VDPVYRDRGPGDDSSDGAGELLGLAHARMETATGPEECFCDFVLARGSSLGDLKTIPGPSRLVRFLELRPGLEPWKGYAIIGIRGSVFQHLRSCEGSTIS